MPSVFTLPSTELGRAWACRQALQAADLNGFRKAKKAAPIREWLRGIVEQILADTPQFEPLWDRVLSRELVEDKVL